MKKTITFALCIAMLLMFSVVSFADGEEQLPPTGLVWDTWESYLENLNETTLNALTTYRKGDVNGDGEVSAADARLCLRAAAQLEALIENQSNAADIDNKSGITSADARQILRIAANLDVNENMNIETTADWGFIIGPLNSAGSGRYFWQCEIDSEGLAVIEEKIDSPDGKDGAPVTSFFVFTPEKTGRYTITLKLADSKQEEVIDEFKVDVLVAAENSGNQ